MIKFLLIIFKIFLTGALLNYASKGIEWHQCKDIMNATAGLSALVVCSLLLLLQNILGGLRIWITTTYTPLYISCIDSVKSYFVGAFFAQMLFSLGGDAMRGWYLHKKFSNILTVSSVVVLDRIIGFICLSCLYFISLYGLSKLLPKSNMFLDLQLLGLFCFTLILGFIVCIKIAKYFTWKILLPLQHLLMIANKMSHFSAKTFTVLSVSFAINLSNVLVIYIAGTFYSDTISFYNCLIVSIPAFLISMAPITIAGWGIRENAFIIGFSLININNNISLLISLTFGIASIIASLPGLIFTLDTFFRFKGHDELLTNSLTEKSIN